jgi:hypothetical protein
MCHFEVAFALACQFLKEDYGTDLRLRFANLLIAFTLMCAVGGHWVLLQSFAWLGMVVSYSQNATFEEALGKTFDGKHPCCLCKHIAESKKAEKKAPFRLELKKLEFAHAQLNYVFCAPAEFLLVPTAQASASLLNGTPPSPPPESLEG